STDYVSASNSTTFTIGQATPTVTVSDAGGTYNGNAFAATGAVAGINGTPGSTLEGAGLAFTYYAGTTPSGTPLSGAPSTAGSYTVVASFTGSTDYVSASNSTTFTIGQATPTVTVSDKGGTYNGNSFAATGAVAGINGTPGSTLEGAGLTFMYYAGATASGTPLSGAPSTASSYTVVASFAGSTDYTSASNSTTFTIGQATPTVSVSDAGGVFNGNPYPAKATATGVGGAAVSGSSAFTYYVGSTVSGTGTSTAPSNPGTYTVVAAFSSTNSNYVTGPTKSVPVTFAINQAPAITSPNKVSFAVGDQWSFAVTAIGYPAPTFAITAGSLPKGLTFTSGILGGTPAAGTAKSYALTITATNGVGTAATQSFTLTVTGSSSAAKITSGKDATFTIGESGDFNVTVNGSPTPILTMNGTLPAGLTFNAATGLVSGTPAAGTAGKYTITFTATNGVGTPASQTFTLTIDQLPAITSPNTATFIVGKSGTFTVTATGFPAPTFLESGTLPRGLKFNTTTGVLSGTPAAGTAKSYTLTFTATNNAGESVAQAFTLVVSNAAPVATTPSVAPATPIGDAGTTATPPVIAQSSSTATVPTQSLPTSAVPQADPLDAAQAELPGGTNDTLAENTTSDNLADNDAIQWAGLTAALKILNA
ncbi:MAG TPA: putative Ig domain-containing protein, partial [Planctomycetaceae bacterium]|nr:putative Ig domain-containing protein [Planctomycetaceae bacterium]